MKTLCTLSLCDVTDPNVWADTAALLNRADALTGTPLVSDQARAEAHSGKRKLFAVLPNSTDGERRIVGVVVRAKHEFDLVIDPDVRGRGFGACALDHVIQGGSGELRTWVHGDQPAAEALLTSRGFQPHRELLEMRLKPVPVADDLPAASPVPDGMRITAFRAEDGPAWVALNARVFATHPEQGTLTLQDLKQRMLEPWFAPEDFLLLWDADELIGYCWLKVVGGIAEIYVIGVAPERSGQSLGSLLLDHATRLAGDCDEMSLFVDGTNTAARALYHSRGFTVVSVSRQWQRT